MSDARPARDGSEKPAFSLTPSVTLPKGGGAIQGIDEKHAVSAATGSASASVGLGLSPGRNMSPALGLSYDAGNGNGPFGLGWSLSIPSITRKTAKGLPRYHKDAAGLEQDTFVLAGAEDLVPIEDGNASYPSPPDQGRGCWTDAASLVGWTVRRYAPRVEAGFSRIELWTDPRGVDTHWRVVGADNSRSIFGRSASARVADPADPRRVASWLLEEVRDGRGEIVRYTYVTEDGAGVDFTQPWETQRRAAAYAQRYLKRVQYGNRAPDVAGDWMFERAFSLTPSVSLPSVTRKTAQGLPSSRHDNAAGGSAPSLTVPSGGRQLDRTAISPEGSSILRQSLYNKDSSKSKGMTPHIGSTGKSIQPYR